MESASFGHRGIGSRSEVIATPRSLPRFCDTHVASTGVWAARGLRSSSVILRSDVRPSMSPTDQFDLQPFIHRGVSLSSYLILSTVWPFRTTLTILDAFHYCGTPDRYDDSMTLVILSQPPFMLLRLLVLVVPPGIIRSDWKP